MTIFELQQSRKAAEVWRGPWQQTLAAIREAKGARECSDVDAEQARKLGKRCDVMIEAAKISNNDKFRATLFDGEVELVPIAEPRGWLGRLLFGAPKLEWHPSDEPGGEGYYE